MPSSDQPPRLPWSVMMTDVGKDRRRVDPRNAIDAASGGRERDAPAWAAPLAIAAADVAALVFYTGAKEGTSAPSLERLVTVLSCADLGLSHLELAKLLALGSTTLLALTLLIGPWHRWAPSRITRALLAKRADLGVATALHALAHAALMLLHRSERVSMLEHDLPLRVAGLTAGSLALLGLVVLASTSGSSGRRRLGERAWQQLHRLAPMTLVLTACHFFAMELDIRTGLHVRAYGLIVLATACTVVIVRLMPGRSAKTLSISSRVPGRSSLLPGNEPPPHGPAGG